ncbi:MAG: hypothetical protein ACTSRI_02475 [Promethearchaeota archaeon]
MVEPIQDYEIWARENTIKDFLIGINKSLSFYFNRLLKDFGDWGKVQTIQEFRSDIKKNLSEKDFNRKNSRIVFSVCPDDINRLDDLETIENALTKEYNGEFHLGGLGAYPIGGVSGITAASHHTPDNIVSGVRKEGNLIFFISPHFGLMREKSGDFIFGKIVRPGQETPTSSCGAMMGFLDQLKEDGSPQAFKIPEDKEKVDQTRVILHQELINNYSDKLDEILKLESDNQQVINLSLLNYEVVTKKLDLMIKTFLNNNHFKGNIAIISGITVNVPTKDYFILKDISYPTQ